MLNKQCFVKVLSVFFFIRLPHSLNDYVLLNKNGFRTLHGNKILSDTICGILTDFEP